jgi:hypothetical protein
MARDFVPASSHNMVYSAPTGIGAITAFSVSVAINKDAFTGAYRDMVWLGGEYNVNHNFLFQHDSSNYLVLDIMFSGNNGRWSVATSDSTWLKFVITYASVDATTDPLFYKNGVADTVTERLGPSGSRATSSSDFVTVGANSNFYGPNNEFWDGRLAEVAIWNRALTSAEAIAVSGGMSARSVPDGLLFYAPLANGEADLVGKSTAVVTGTTDSVHPPTNFIKNNSNILRPAVFSPGVAR